jgi:pyruvate/2-oxoglutarate/acetoin dehydrogenase E1 component
MAIRDDNPVVFFEDKMMYQLKGPLNYHKVLSQVRKKWLARTEIYGSDGGNSGVILSTGQPGEVLITERQDG